VYQLRSEALLPRRFYRDGSYAPADREAFDQQLAAFYSSHSAVQASCRAATVWCPHSYS
jgi:hypothetical protein